MITDDESMHAAELDMISVADGSNMCFAQRHFVKNLFGKPERRRKESCSLPKKSYLKTSSHFLNNEVHFRRVCRRLVV